MNARQWGMGDRRRIATRDFPSEVLALVDVRLRALEHGGRYCVDCEQLGLVAPADEPLEVDHLQALSRGGDNHHLNLTWRCRSHNRSKGASGALDTPKSPKWQRRAVREGGDREA